MRVSPARIDPSHTAGFKDEEARLKMIKDYWQARGVTFEGYIVSHGFNERTRGAVLGIKSETVNGFPKGYKSGANG